LLGKRNDVKDILAESDIFCLFSEREGLPVSVLEAMAAGLPVIASKVGGIPEMIEHGRTGYLIENGDESKTEEHLAELIRHKEKKMSLGTAAKAEASERFSLERMVRAYRSLYEEPLAD
jgi:glycosyltransferase involved in cell wall biosynthesis